jgi:hypothetical protein
MLQNRNFRINNRLWILQNNKNFQINNRLWILQNKNFKINTRLWTLQNRNFKINNRLWILQNNRNFKISNRLWILQNNRNFKINTRLWTLQNRNFKTSNRLWILDLQFTLSSHLNLPSQHKSGCYNVVFPFRQKRDLICASRTGLFHRGLSIPKVLLFSPTKEQRARCAHNWRPYIVSSTQAVFRKPHVNIPSQRPLEAMFGNSTRAVHSLTFLITSSTSVNHLCNLISWKHR